MEDIAPPKSSILPVAAPLHSAHFDAWNSSSTGHQRGENRLSRSVGWRESRSVKLHDQLRSGSSGGERIADQVGAGSDDWDLKAKAPILKEVKTRAIVSIADMLMAKGIGTLYYQENQKTLIFVQDIGSLRLQGNLAERDARTQNVSGNTGITVFSPSSTKYLQCFQILGQPNLKREYLMGWSST